MTADGPRNGQMPVTGSATVAFALDRLELDAGQLTVAGRWSGVRGRRFVRPSLSSLGGERSTRVLAGLEHKPWAASDGETWVAAFPWEGSAPADAEFELSVAPDICIRLPSPRSGVEGELVLEAYRPADAPDGGRPRRSRPRRPTETPAPRDHQSRRQSEAGRSASERHADAARAERDEAVLRTQQAEARQAELTRQWEHAGEQRDSAVSERDTARGERDDARAQVEASAAELQSLRAEIDGLIVARDKFAAALAGASEARDRAIQQRDRAVAERDAVAGELRVALSELERRRSAPLPTAVPAPTPPPAAVPVRAAVPIIPASQPTAPLLTRSDVRVNSRWTARIVAFAAIAVVVLVLLTIVAK